jgi:putative membrane protein
MKKLIFMMFVAGMIGSFASSASAQMMGGFSNSTADWEEVVAHTLREEKEGKELWDKFQAKEVACENLNDEQFGVLGEYFMGTMTGESHPAMNAMLMQMHGEEGEEQMHIIMGKRLSGCDTSASLAAEWSGGMPMMNMMWGGWSSGFNNNLTNNNMMNFGFGTMGGFGFIFMILWWVLIIAGIVALIKWFTSQSSSTGGSHEKSSLDILKERYAKGEINKQEFEDKKKDLGV